MGRRRADHNSQSNEDEEEADITPHNAAGPV